MEGEFGWVGGGGVQSHFRVKPNSVELSWGWVGVVTINEKYSTTEDDIEVFMNISGNKDFLGGQKFILTQKFFEIKFYYTPKDFHGCKHILDL